MTSVLFRNGVANYFHYDAKQRRYAIQESTGTTYFTYDIDGLCELLERDNSGSIAAEYTRGYAPIEPRLVEEGRILPRRASLSHKRTCKDG